MRLQQLAHRGHRSGDRIFESNHSRFDVAIFEQLKRVRERFAGRDLDVIAKVMSRRNVVKRTFFSLNGHSHRLDYRLWRVDPGSRKYFQGGTMEIWLWLGGCG